MKDNNNIQLIPMAVDAIKTAILQSQARAAQSVNQEQLALYYGIGRFISVNTRNKNWGQGVLEQISEHLRQELPGLRGFSSTNLKNMRLFYEAWIALESNSSAGTDDLESNSAIAIAESSQPFDTEQNIIRQLCLTNLHTDAYSNYGKQILATVSQTLQREYGSDYSYSALTRMIFKVAQYVTQLPDKQWFIDKLNRSIAIAQANKSK